MPPRTRLRPDSDSTEGSLRLNEPVVKLEIFDLQLRRSLVSGGANEYLSQPLYWPLGVAYSKAEVHLTLRTNGYVGGTPTVKIEFEDTSDGLYWSSFSTTTLVAPGDGTYRFPQGGPFGAFLRVKMTITGAGALPALVLCRGWMTLRRRPPRAPVLTFQSPPPDVPPNDKKDAEGGTDSPAAPCGCHACGDPTPAPLGPSDLAIQGADSHDDQVMVSRPGPVLRLGRPSHLQPGGRLVVEIEGVCPHGAWLELDGTPLRAAWPIRSAKDPDAIRWALEPGASPSLLISPTGGLQTDVVLPDDLDGGNHTLQLITPTSTHPPVGIQFTTEANPTAPPERAPHEVIWDLASRLRPLAGWQIREAELHPDRRWNGGDTRDVWGRMHPDQKVVPPVLEGSEWTLAKTLTPMIHADPQLSDLKYVDENVPVPRENAQRSWEVEDFRYTCVSNIADGTDGNIYYVTGDSIYKIDSHGSVMASRVIQALVTADPPHFPDLPGDLDGNPHTRTSTTPHLDSKTQGSRHLEQAILSPNGPLILRETTPDGNQHDTLFIGIDGYLLRLNSDLVETSRTELSYQFDGKIRPLLPATLSWSERASCLIIVGQYKQAALDDNFPPEEVSTCYLYAIDPGGTGQDAIVDGPIDVGELVFGVYIGAVNSGQIEQDVRHIPSQYFNLSGRMVVTGEVRVGNTPSVANSTKLANTDLVFVLTWHEIFAIRLDTVSRRFGPIEWLCQYGPQQSQSSPDVSPDFNYVYFSDGLPKNDIPANNPGGQPEPVYAYALRTNPGNASPGAYFDLRQSSPLGFPPRDILDAYVDLDNAEVGTSFIQGEDGDGNLLFFIAPILSPLMGYRHIKGVGGAPGKIEIAWVGARDVVMSGANSMRVEEVLFTSAFADPATSTDGNLFRAVGLDTSVPGGAGTTVYADSNHLLWSFNLDAADYCTRSASIHPSNGVAFYFGTVASEGRPGSLIAIGSGSSHSPGSLEVRATTSSVRQGGRT